MEKKIKHPDLLHSCCFSLCVHANVNKRERERETGWRGREGPCVHWRQPKASVCRAAFRAEMIRGSGPDTFIRVLHRDGVQAQRADE